MRISKESGSARSGSSFFTRNLATTDCSGRLRVIDVKEAVFLEFRMEGQAHHAFLVFHQLGDLAPIEKDLAILLGRVGPVRKNVDDAFLRDDEEPIRAVARVGNLQRPLESQVGKRLFDLQRRQRIGRTHQPGSIDGERIFRSRTAFPPPMQTAK